MAYSSKPQSDVYCLRLNFNIGLFACQKLVKIAVNQQSTEAQFRSLNIEKCKFHLFPV